MYAVWSQTAGIIIFVTNILLISTPSALIPFISVYNVKRQLMILSKVIIVLIPIFILFMILILSFDHQISYFLWGSKIFYILILPIFFWIFSESIFELSISIWRVQEKYYLCSLFYTLKYSLRLLFLFLFAENNLNSLETILWAIASVQILLVIPFILIIFKYVKFSNLKKTKNIIYLGFNISILGIISYFANFSDRFLIVHKIGLENLTPYVLAFSVGGIISIIYSTLGFTLFPKMSKLKKNSAHLSRSFENCLRIYFFIGCSGVSFLTMQGSNIINLLTDYNFLIPNSIFLFVSTCIFLNGIQQLFQYFQLIKSSLRSTQIGLIVAGIFMFLLNWFYLKKFGIEFAAITICCGSIITIIIIIAKEYKIIPNINVKILFKFVIFGILSCYFSNLFDIDVSLFFLISTKFLLQSCLLLIFDYMFGKHFYSIIFLKKS